MPSPSELFPRLFNLYPDISGARSVLDRVNRLHFSGRVTADAVVGIPLPASTGTGGCRAIPRFGEIPAVGYDRHRDAIVIHPHIFHRNPPKYLLRYLIHHGCLLARQQRRGADARCVHPLCPVQAYGNRSNRWLVREGFPTLPVSGLDDIDIDVMEARIMLEEIPHEQ